MTLNGSRGLSTFYVIDKRVKMNLPTNTTNKYFLCAFYIINLLLVYTNIYLFTLNEQFSLSNQRQARMSGLSLPVSTLYRGTKLIHLSVQTEVRPKKIVYTKNHTIGVIHKDFFQIYRPGITGPGPKNPVRSQNGR